MNASTGKHDTLFHRVQPEKSDRVSARHDQHLEQTILKFSVFAALFFAVLGLIWGALIRSQMLVFDGIYSSVSLIMAGLSVYVSKSMEGEVDERLPYGRSQMAPLVIILKSIAIIVVCVIAFSKAVSSLSSGGREINTYSAMVYSLIGIVGCLGSWIYIIRKRKKALTSGLVKAEGMQWLVDTLLSAAIFLGFLMACIMQDTEHARYARYMDPLMTIVAALFFVAVPAVSLVTGIKDMLKMAPGGNIYRVSKMVLGEIAKKRGFDGFSLRICKAGRKLFYEIGFVSSDPEDVRSIGELDGIRQEIEAGLHALYDNPIGLDISFMHDKKWG